MLVLVRQIVATPRLYINIWTFETRIICVPSLLPGCTGLVVASNGSQTVITPPYEYTVDMQNILWNRMFLEVGTVRLKGDSIHLMIT